MKIKLAVLFGGKSTEHEISIISAIQAIGYLNKETYEVIPIYLSKSNELYVGEDIGKIEEYRNIDSLVKKSQRVILVNDSGKTKIVKYPFKPFSKNEINNIDILFPIVHGVNVEDGNLQGYLNTLDIPYVGCDVVSSAVGMDKYFMKAVLKDNGIPVLEGKRYHEKDYYDNSERLMESIKNHFKFPLIVKPNNQGSSIGISKAADDAELADALELAFSYSDKIIIEPFIENLQEINCSVIGDDSHAEASECEEPINTDVILSYKDKYISGGKSKSVSGKGMSSLQRKIPAEISEETKNAIREMAVKAFQCLGCNGISRIDFMIDKSNGTIYLNEINTMPGSLAFYLWEPCGLSFPDLLDKVIGLALKRQREKERIIYSFESNVLSGAVLSNNKGAKKV